MNIPSKKVKRLKNSSKRQMAVRASADNAYLIEDLMARTAGRFNTIKIVPLVTFQGLIERCKRIEEWTFFPDAAG
jgi:hypothetical protein